MRTRIEGSASQPVATNLGGALLSAALTLAALGVAIWALESAEWVNPRPSFLFALLLGVAGGTALGRTRLGRSGRLPAHYRWRPGCRRLADLRPVRPHRGIEHLVALG